MKNCYCICMLPFLCLAVGVSVHSALLFFHLVEGENPFKCEPARELFLANSYSH